MTGTGQQGTPDASDEAPVPSTDELRATDALLDRLARRADATSDDLADPVAALLRAASAPGDEAELSSSAAFVAAVEHHAAARSAIEPEPPRSVRLWGKAIAVKVLVLAAVATLGLAGAGAATGVVLRTIDEDPPPSTVEVDPPPDAAHDRSTSAPGGESTRRTASMPLDEARAAVATCAAATSPDGAALLEQAAATRGVAPGTFCAEAAATLAAAGESAGDPTSGDLPTEDAVDDTSTTPGTGWGAKGSNADPPSGAEPSGGSKPSNNGNRSGNGNQSNHANPKAGNGAANGAGNGAANGSNGTGNPSSNANPNAGTGAANGANRANPSPNGGTASGNRSGNANPNAGNGAASSSRPNSGNGAAANAPERRNDTSGTSSAASAGAGRSAVSDETA